MFTCFVEFNVPNQGLTCVDKSKVLSFSLYDLNGWQRQAHPGTAPPAPVNTSLLVRYGYDNTESFNFLTEEAAQAAYVKLRDAV